MVRLKHSKNGEKLFYENIVQIGDMKDSGTITDDGKVCAQILNEYALSFKERNPNLKVFNMILHLDEKTPHLHIDYIPVGETSMYRIKIYLPGYHYKYFNVLRCRHINNPYFTH